MRAARWILLSVVLVLVCVPRATRPGRGRRHRYRLLARAGDTPSSADPRLRSPGASVSKHRQPSSPPCPAGGCTSRAGSRRTEAPWLLVIARARAANSRCWLQVRLPWRPNGSTGWINANKVVLERTPWRVVISTARRTLTLFRAGKAVRTVSVVVGKPSTPTPDGLFAVWWAIPWQPDDFLGSWVLELTAHSDVLQQFDGGDGTVAIHGRGGASLAGPGRHRSQSRMHPPVQRRDRLARTDDRPKPTTRHTRSNQLRRTPARRRKALTSCAGVPLAVLSDLRFSRSRPGG